ncbi:hypothetical protein [Mycolicibacterium hodleri]|uniref:Uncharacterized protein n=1 Tax=Mycolicibacterium hodleri TaxID=49897 RepID=A0A502E2X3_9MYCO|nr:hypothetical protein [Mycolicibacterium hodleri]TPG31664.1 hypothetical protein EAH80_22175 [Mycolicibacterium hodleri]
MTSMIIARSGHCLAAVAVLVGISFGAPSVAGAVPVDGYDNDAFIACVKPLQNKDPDLAYKFLSCCQEAGGVPTVDGVMSCAKPTVQSNPTGKTPPPEPPVIMRPAPGSTSVG